MTLSPEERRKIYEEEKARIEAREQLERERGKGPGETSTGLTSNIAGMLCYIGAWITGIIFLVLEKKNERVRVKSVAGFMPLWAGVATPERAQRLVREHLLNEKEFWTPYPVASYAKTEPDYYQGVVARECNWRGSTWAPANYMIFHGLMNYGFQAEARELADRLFRMALDVNPATREFYNAETGAGLGQTQFWGFSALYYVMPLECQLNYNPADLNKDIQPIVPRHLGVPFTPNVPAASPAKN